MAVAYLEDLNVAQWEVKDAQQIMLPACFCAASTEPNRGFIVHGQLLLQAVRQHTLQMPFVNIKPPQEQITKTKKAKSIEV